MWVIYWPFKNRREGSAPEIDTNAVTARTQSTTGMVESTTNKLAY